MDILQMFLNDPVVFISFAGLLILFGICGYYVYYFMTHIKEEE